jgi:putative endonuclease
MPDPQRTVYILQSTTQEQRFYTGLTSNLELRLRTHNAGLSCHTATGRPWRVVVAVEFADPRRAASFEKYLKSGSGRVFAARHLR